MLIGKKTKMKKKKEKKSRYFKCDLILKNSCIKLASTVVEGES